MKLSAPFLSFALLFLSLLVGCAANSNQQEISYDYTQNSCPTGKHTFSSNDDMCEGLKNETLNNGCASSLRQQALQTQCPGKSWN